MPIRKCEHSVYISEGESRALYCRICTPGGPTNTKDVVLPRSSAISLSNAGRMMANSNKSGTGCPECGSAIYLRTNERNPTNRECADCGAHYRKRLDTHQLAMKLKEEMDYE
jgi:predicted RNA-binding Zn-ribbon protein involved in translation (DUF1610 family)